MQSYKRTIYCCFTGYIVQAGVNNFAPLLFLTFQKQYDIPLYQITALITINFIIQLAVDFAAAFFVDKIGYRASLLLAHGFAAAGLLLLTVLPDLFPSAFLGLLTAVFFYAIGGGLLEVVISPVVEACPSKHKDRTMSMLHSFYCWGSVGVVGISSLFFLLFGIENWKIMAAIWAILPIVNGLMFIKAPLYSLIPEGEQKLSIWSLFKNKMFWFFMVIILCAGASEQSVSQWSSAFVESALGISKTYGDLVGPALFSVLMGCSRLIYGKFGDRIDLKKMIFLSSGLAVVSYILISLTSSPVWSLIGIALCGFSVGILWPGTYSSASAAVKGGGNAMFSMLALAGDLGCASGPTFVGFVSDAAAGNLKIGIAAAVIFPLVLTVLMAGYIVKRRRNRAEPAASQ